MLYGCLMKFANKDDTNVEWIWSGIDEPPMSIYSKEGKDILCWTGVTTKLPRYIPPVGSRIFSDDGIKVVNSELQASMSATSSACNWRHF